MQVFFITNHENVEHQKIQKVIHENRDKLKFLVTTSSDGELNFYKHHKGTRKHVQKILLPLKDLWANPPKKKQINQQTTSTRGKKSRCSDELSYSFSGSAKQNCYLFV